MNDELYELYQKDKDFKEYVDKWCHNHDLSIFEAFNFNILREYAKYVKEKNR